MSHSIVPCNFLGLWSMLFYAKTNKAFGGSGWTTRRGGARSRPPPSRRPGSAPWPAPRARHRPPTRAREARAWKPPGACRRRGEALHHQTRRDKRTRWTSGARNQNTSLDRQLFSVDHFRGMPSFFNQKGDATHSCYLHGLK